MLINEPRCGFHNCRKYFDGNCRSQQDFDMCEYQYYKDVVENDKNCSNCLVNYLEEDLDGMCIGCVNGRNWQSAIV